MNPTEITITKGLTLNLGNYQTERIDITMRGTVEAGETWSQAFVKLNTAVEAGLQTLTAPVLDNMRAVERESILRLFETQPTALTTATDPAPAPTNAYVVDTEAILRLLNPQPTDPAPVATPDEDSDNAFGYDEDDETESDFDEDDFEDDDGVDEDAVDELHARVRHGTRL